MKTSSPTAIKPPTPLKVLVMGPPGSRKTTFLLQCPNLLVLDCDRNLSGPELVLRQGIPGQKVAPIKPDLSYFYEEIRFEEDGKTPRPLEECFDRVIDILTAVAKSPKDYPGVNNILGDSLSHVNEFIIRKVLKMKSKPSMEPNHWTDFKSYAYTFLVSKLEGTGKNVFCTAHEIKLEEADKSNIMSKIVTGYEPFFQGKIGDTIGAFFTDIWRTKLVNEPGGKIAHYIETVKTPKCEFLKNSLGMPAELNITEGWKAIEPYLKGRI